MNELRIPYIENWICDLRVSLFLKAIQWFNRRRWRSRGYIYSLEVNVVY